MVKYFNIDLDKIRKILNNGKQDQLKRIQSAIFSGVLNVHQLKTLPEVIKPIIEYSPSLPMTVCRAVVNTVPLLSKPFADIKLTFRHGGTLLVYIKHANRFNQKYWGDLYNQLKRADKIMIGRIDSHGIKTVNINLSAIKIQHPKDIRIIPVNDISRYHGTYNIVPVQSNMSYATNANISLNHSRCLAHIYNYLIFKVPIKQIKPSQQTKIQQYHKAIGEPAIINNNLIFYTEYYQDKDRKKAGEQNEKS